MKALILAAGYATRLYPLTKEYPKALLRVKRKPIIEYIIEKLEKVSLINEIIVVTNSKFYSHFKNWQAKLNSSKPISIIDDLTKDNETRRGAIGDINFTAAKKNIKEDLLVIGGDNLFDGDLSGFLAFAQTHKYSPLIGAYKLKERAEASKYGVVRLNKKSRLVDFQEKPKNPKSKLVAMCLYYFPKEKLGLIRKYMDKKTQKSDATGFYIDWLRKRIAVYAFVFSGRWFDIGDYKFYNQAKKAFKQ